MFNAFILMPQSIRVSEYSYLSFAVAGVEVAPTKHTLLYLGIRRKVARVGWSEPRLIYFFQVLSLKEPLPYLSGILARFKSAFEILSATAYL